MAKYRVKAYYMHESERAAAEQAAQSAVIQNAEWTDGYVLGIVDERKIKNLSDEGLVVSVVEKVVPQPTPETLELATLSLPEMPRLAARRASRGGGPIASGGHVVPVASAAPRPKQKILSHDKRRTQYYVVRFHGPVTPERQKQLDTSRIKLVERLSRNKYTVRLKPSEVQRLAELEFVDTIRLYTAEDTLYEPTSKTADRPATAAPRTAGAARGRRTARPVTASGGARARKPAARTRIYSVSVHRTQDLPAVVRWLKGKRRKPLSKGHSALRIALTENSRVLAELAALPEVAMIEPVEPPRLLDEHARKILQVDALAANPTGLEGDGEIIGIVDTGLDTDHPDFRNRIVGTSAWGRPGDASDPDGHGTHVAGCAAGDGTASGGEVRGAAPKAKIFFQSVLDADGNLGGLPDDLTEMFQEAYDKGARIHNNSWGAFTFSRYTDNSTDVDRFVAEHPDMLLVIAAGNEGIGIPRKRGARMSAAQGFVDWPCVAAPATAKNGLTVGASRSSRRSGGYAQLTWGDAWPDEYPHPPIANEKVSGKDKCLAAFSSRGPTTDQQIKPEVVAPGTDIAAARSKDAPLRNFWGAYPQNAKYGFMGGTSMAAPYVAGCAALVREWFRKKANWPTPSAALLKATLINGTRRITGDDAVAPIEGEPNFHQGFGRIDLANTVPNSSAPGLKLEFVDSWQTPALSLHRAGERRRYQIKAAAGHPLRMCLVWTDPPGRAIQNTLTLLADDPRRTKRVANTGIAAVLNVAGAPDDPHNNVQSIRIARPVAGLHTLAITISNTPQQPQTFALVVTGKLQSPLTLLPEP